LGLHERSGGAARGPGRRSIDRRALPYRLRAWIPSTKGALHDAVASVLRCAVACRCPEDRLADLEISVREALANAIQHGNGNRRRRKVFLRCYAGPQAGIVVAVRDEGQGFDPRRVPDPRRSDRRFLAHGRGLLLMRELMDDVSFRRGGREVVLYCKLPG
jgi:serine/threonine-protein kinase RsbW